MMSHYRIGDAVTLLKPVSGNYSGYAGRPEFTAPAGTVVVITAGPVPKVSRQGSFYTASIGKPWPVGKPLRLPDIQACAECGAWPEGLTIEPGQFRKAAP